MGQTVADLRTALTRLVAAVNADFITGGDGRRDLDNALSLAEWVLAGGSLDQVCQPGPK